MATNVAQIDPAVFSIASRAASKNIDLFWRTNAELNNRLFRERFLGSDPAVNPLAPRTQEDEPGAPDEMSETDPKDGSET